MKIIALEKELSNARTIDFRKNAKAEAKALWKLYINGIVRKFYFRKVVADTLRVEKIILQNDDRNRYKIF